MVCGDINGTVRNWRIRLPILAVRVHRSAGGTVFAGAAGADLRELTDLPDVHYNIPSDDTAEPVRDDRDD